MSSTKEPGVIGLFFGAFFGVFLGSVLALIHLVDRPVEVVSKLPAEPEAGKLYYEKPARVSLKTWENRKSELEAGAGTVVLNEAELGSLVAFGLMSSLREGREAPAADAETLDLAATVADGVGLRLRDGEVMIGVEVETRRVGGPRPLVLQTNGTFEKVTMGWVYRPLTATLGGLELHRLPGGKAAMAVIGRKLTPEALRKAGGITLAAGGATIELR